MLFIGIDVQVRRSAAWAVLDAEYRGHSKGWIPCSNCDAAIQAFGTLVEKLSRSDEVVVAIDAPRMPLPAPRSHQWSRAAWSAGASLRGRHCELVIKNLGLANPQWTPLAKDATSWMNVGFSLFAHLGQQYPVYEVFPSASYRLLTAASEPRFELSLSGFAPGPKDMLDAYVSALTAGEFVAGRGCEVGGGDGLGTIVLPRPCSPRFPALLRWPSSGASSGPSA